MVAEELAKSFLVPGDAMFFEECKKTCGRETGERGFGEVGIGGDKVFRGAMNIGEIATATAGNEDFLADAVGTFEDGDSAAALSCLDGAEEAGGASAEN
jgi:hypothetical protein